MRFHLDAAVPLPHPAGDAVTWTDVLEAVGTVVGAIATATTLIFLLLQLRAQQTQTNIQSEQARKRQAEHVVPSLARGDETEDAVTFHFTVENRSNRPCYFLYLEIFDEHDVVYFRYGSLDTGPAVGTVDLGARFRSSGAEPDAGPSWPFFRVSFMDAANVFWVRDSLGVLAETRAGVPSSWPEHGTLAEKRAYEMVTRTVRPSAPPTASPEQLSPFSRRIPLDES